VEEPTTVVPKVETPKLPPVQAQVPPRRVPPSAQRAPKTDTFPAQQPKPVQTPPVQTAPSGGNGQFPPGQNPAMMPGMVPQRKSNGPLIAIIIAVAAIVIVAIVVVAFLFWKGVLALGSDSSSGTETVVVTSTSQSASTSSSTSTTRSTSPSTTVSTGEQPANTIAGFTGKYTSCNGADNAVFLGYSRDHGTVVVCRNSTDSLYYKSDWDGGTLTSQSVSRSGSTFYVNSSPYTIILDNNQLRVQQNSDTLAQANWTWYSNRS
ncbi:MAG: hypothetical protein Q3962_03170, partial [Corynebacterium sp.]|nr:hypothetical protein [Corynebacterium sp.]